MSDNLTSNMEQLQKENKALRLEIHFVREQGLATLRERVTLAEKSSEHYKAEAQRNADLGRQIASESEKKIIELKAKITILEEVQTNVRRNRTYRTYN